MHVLLVVSGMVWVAAAVILAVVILHRYGWGYTRVSTKHEQKSSNLGTLTAVTVVFTITLWMRLVGATAAGWMADRMGRKTPLMISILWYSLCNFIAGFSPTFAFLFFFRALLGIGMGAEWPSGAALAMESAEMAAVIANGLSRRHCSSCAFPRKRRFKPDEWP